MRAHNFDDKTGRVYGKLTVVELNKVALCGNGKKKAVWVCLCSCGRRVSVYSGNLTSGNTTNCGCVRDQRLRVYVETKIKLPKGEASFNSVFLKYKQGAANRGHSFTVSAEEFRAKCLSTCYYCGATPANVEHNKARNGDFIYNGIDRIDNTHGYESQNTVSCCKVCNYMKHVLTQAEFFAHIERIYNNHRSIK